MTTIYLINNTLTMNNLDYPDDTLEQRRQKRILSIEGEKESEELVNIDYLKRVNVIYSSPYVMAVGTAKYLARKLELETIITRELGERVLGAIGDKKIRMVSEMQENDFSYKLSGGESLNDAKRRMSCFINKIRRLEKDKTIAMFTHNVAITSYLSEYCNKGFNLDNRLILNYGEEAIIDGAWDGINIIEIIFEGDNVVSIKRKK